MIGKLVISGSVISIVGCVISNVHPDLLRGVGRCQDTPAGDVLGTVEYETVSAGVIAVAQALQGERLIDPIVEKSASIPGGLNKMIEIIKLRLNLKYVCAFGHFIEKLSDL